MHRIIAMTALSLALSGGVALADNRGERVEHRETRIDHREGYRDVHARPAARFERHEERPGSRRAAGDWRWNGGRWNWQSGRYIRGRR